jgi:hypothetical protein
MIDKASAHPAGAGRGGENRLAIQGTYLTAELARDYAGRIPVLFLGKVVAVTRIERVTRGL